MSILARFTSTCSHCDQVIEGGRHRVERVGRSWVHEWCRIAIVAKRLEDYSIIQLPEARGSADREPVTGSNARIRRRRGNRGRRKR